MAQPQSEALTLFTPFGYIIKDCPDCPDMVVIPAGSFNMGSDKGGDETPAHHVTISKAFAIGKTEVTQGQWKAVMGSNPSNFANCGDDCPVEKVSWDDAKQFIQKLNSKTGKQYRLPSEAEWEYACRAGSQTEYCGGDNVDSVAWYKCSPFVTRRVTNCIPTRRVGTRKRSKCRAQSLLRRMNIPSFDKISET